MTAGSETRPAPTSDQDNPVNDFEHWIAGTFARTGPFAVLVVLVEIVESRVVPMCSTYFSVAAEGFEWSDVAVIFAGSGGDWGGAAFFPVFASNGGLPDNPTMRLRSRELEARIDGDLLALNDGAFFDQSGRRAQIDKQTLLCVPALP
jgi:hypothetical protein